ncbi:catalase family protein [Pseudorhodoferax sp. Leaf267]|uniref:catalase family protein n=1 Tax=Pseudorhodoferax sp. Leaf267 TaxID=1736316 RepID=UPI0006FAD083|nr:catalase family protein [Pseudorhodoferax sp. Leaf267]KQP17796.1 catalase [Pseudorhodoferax sp. Leaf267]
MPSDQPLPPFAPLVYEPRFEEPEEDEAETTREMSETLTEIAETVRRDEGHAFRGVHAKSHGLLRGELEVLAGLPPVLAQGLFAQPGRHPAVMRLSTTPGDLLDDAVSTPRGLALKVLDVPGARLQADDGAATQDFLMVNGPVFSVPTAKKFLRSLKLLASTTDRLPGAKKILSAALRGLEAIIEKAGGESGTVKAMGGHPATNPLGETYYTQVPLLYGPYMAKLSLAPVAPELTALTDAKVDLADAPDALRDAVVVHFAQHGGVWELRAQLCTDLESMPIEDASVQWPEDLSPFVTVARLTVPPQAAWSAQRAAAIDDGMSFSPWHGLAAHRPIGSIMRVRQLVYENAARFRSQHNATQVQEPRDVSHL